MRVVVFEAHQFGHRLSFVREIISAVHRLGIVPVFATTQAVVASQEFDIFLKTEVGKFEVHIIEQDLFGVSYKRLSRIFLDINVALKPDFVYIPSGDGLAQWIGIRHRTSVSRIVRKTLASSEILLIGGRLGYPSPVLRRVRNKLSIYSVNLKAWAGVFHLDAIQARFLRREGGSRVLTMPDPVMRAAPCPKHQARENLGLPSGGNLIGCTGWIERSKGCHLLVDAFAQAAENLSPVYRLLLAGQFRDGLKEYIARRYPNLLDQGRVLVLDRLLSEREIDWVVQSLDVLCLPYLRAYQSSGVFLRGVAEQIPLLVNSQGWLLEMVTRLGNGYHVDVHDQPAFARAICRSLQPSQHQIDMDSPCIQRFLEFHSAANFRANWTRRLCEVLKLPSDPAIRDWDSIW